MAWTPRTPTSGKEAPTTTTTRSVLLPSTNLDRPTTPTSSPTAWYVHRVAAELPFVYAFDRLHRMPSCVDATCLALLRSVLPLRAQGLHLLRKGHQGAAQALSRLGKSDARSATTYAWLHTSNSTWCLLTPDSFYEND
jgi:hypothetical protein